MWDTRLKLVLLDKIHFICQIIKNDFFGGWPTYYMPFCLEIALVFTVVYLTTSSGFQME